MDGTVRVLDLQTGAAVALPGSVRVRDARLESVGNGRFVGAGGNEGSPDAPVASARVSLVDPELGVIDETTLDLARRQTAVAVVSGNVLVLGGRTAEGAPSPASGLILIGSNPLVTSPGARRLRRAYDKLGPGRER